MPLDLNGVSSRSSACADNAAIANSRASGREGLRRYCIDISVEWGRVSYAPRLGVECSAKCTDVSTCLEQLHLFPHFLRGGSACTLPAAPNGATRERSSRLPQRPHLEQSAHRPLLGCRALFLDPHAF